MLLWLLENTCWASWRSLRVSSIVSSLPVTMNTGHLPDRRLTVFRMPSSSTASSGRATMGVSVPS